MSAPRSPPLILVGLILFALSSSVFGLVWFWVQSAHYRRERLLRIVDDPSLILEASPLLLAAIALSVLAILAGPILVWRGLARRARDAG